LEKLIKKLKYLYPNNDIKTLPITHPTSNLGIWFNGKIGLYLIDLANPKNNADLTQTACSGRTLYDTL